MGGGEWVSGLDGLAQRGCSAVFETAQYHPTLSLSAMTMLSSHIPLGPLDWLVAPFGIISENSYCKRFSEGLSSWLNYPC